MHAGWHLVETLRDRFRSTMSAFFRSAIVNVISVPVALWARYLTSSKTV